MTQDILNLKDGKDKGQNFATLITGKQVATNCLQFRLGPKYKVFALLSLLLCKPMQRLVEKVKSVESCDRVESLFDSELEILKVRLVISALQFRLFSLHSLTSNGLYLCFPSSSFLGQP